MDKIVIIEDDPGIRTVLRLALKEAGFTSVITETNGESGLRTVLRERPTLVILDLMLPETDGFAVCRELRRNASTAATPIIMLTARSAEDDIVRGLELGADDYVTKPFSKAVLIARIRAALRRPATARGTAMSLYGLTIDGDARTASLDSAPLALTRSEFDLLQLLVTHPGRVYTRRQIIETSRNENHDVTERTVDTLLVGLRRKLGKWSQHLETIRGVGYRITT